MPFALALLASSLLLSMLWATATSHKRGDRMNARVAEKVLLESVEPELSLRHLATVGRKVTPIVEGRDLEHFDWLSDVTYQDERTILISAEEWALYEPGTKSWYWVSGRLSSEGVEFVVLRRDPGMLYCR